MVRKPEDTVLTFDVWVGATLLVVVALAVVDGVVVGEAEVVEGVVVGAAEVVEGVVVGEADTGVVVITVGCVVAAAVVAADPLWIK